MLIDLLKDSGDVLPEPSRWQRWLVDFGYWNSPRESAVLAGVFRYDFARQGRVPHILDALMVATPVVRDASLVTSDMKD